MSEETIAVDVTCSWVAGNQKSLKDAISLTPLSGYNRNDDGTLTDMVDLDSCILLAQPREENGNQDAVSQPCSITLRLKSNSLRTIDSIVVVCEARIIEVYGQHCEYLSTVSAELLDEMDDMTVYCAEIGLPLMGKECTLKFARLRKASEMWLYGIKVIWNIESSHRKLISPTSSVNFETVEQRLKESHTPLSDRAENCKQFLKMYSSLSNDKKPFQDLVDPLSLLSLLPTGRKRANLHESSVLHSVAQSFGNGTSITGSSVINNERGLSHDEGSCEKHESFCCKKCSHNIESILDKKLMLMENRLLKALDDKMAALQHHQDRQIENLLYHITKSGATLSKVSTPKPNNSVESDKDLKMEQVIKQMIDQKGIYLPPSSNETIHRRNACDDPKDTDILRNALLAMQLNGMFTETSHQSGLEDRSGPTVVQKSS